MTLLTISLVTYHPDIPMLRDTLASLRVAVDHAVARGEIEGARLTLVDNGNDAGLAELAAENGWAELRLITGQGNVGFGRGHNLAIEEGVADFHLILNPDVYILPEALSRAFRFLGQQPACGLLSPSIVGGEDGWHFLCKRYPSLLGLALRGFAPHWLRRLFRGFMSRYEMKQEGDQAVLWDPPIVSGCFMLWRRDVLIALKGFDPRFFLYFEDFDISLRAGKVTRVAAVAVVRIAHFGGGAARKGWKHVRMFARSARLFFGLHGWKWI
ncbi:glycosyltransferase [Uliginosibacterium paludis]|uniref:Glycosyltransferase n=1 Tax=Uliginosibacterium paludis TaxID=1615952 RepID=A0ABV2CMR6_9RHOO